MRELLQRLLGSDGHIVQTATNGRDGMVLFEEGEFDLVILDYEMPDMKGDELALIIKALAPNQPLMMLTGFPETLTSNLLTEVDMVISKPFQPQELLTAARNLLKREGK